jgi:hypothetical protein
MARAKLGVRKRISGLIKDRVERWVEFMPGRTVTERQQNFSVIFSAMAGAVSVARILTTLPTGRRCWPICEIIFCTAFDFCF